MAFDKKLLIFFLIFMTLNVLKFLKLRNMLHIKFKKIVFYRRNGFINRGNGEGSKIKYGTFKSIKYSIYIIRTCTCKCGEWSEKGYNIELQVSSYSCPVIKSWCGSPVPHSFYKIGEISTCSNSGGGEVGKIDR